MKSLSAILVAAAVLAGCGSGSGPSESEMKNALQAAFKENDFVTVLSVKKIGCKEDGSNAYRCDVEVDQNVKASNFGPGGRKTDTTNIRFVKASDGWKALN